ncbi:1047_t:CDS:2 [Dentiscutata erythropus]|uniref:1047_t:CDS:1 n=1 Tax=Dentiscutata erythropus TaxID=1348616 RepID=A0A9N9FN55_9GLOM|nr:1047_t:CDS:2 [Dentiscutata erythropus]
MSYQALNSTGGQDLESNVARHDGNSENERYPFGIPITLCRNVAIQMGLLFVLTYKSNDYYQPPWYWMLIYALFNSYTIGSIVCLLDITCIVDLLIILFIVSLSLICFTLQTTYQFKSKEPLFLACITIIVTSLILHPLIFSIIDAVPAVSIALLLSLFFIFDTWYMMDNMNKDEFKGAGMQIILDLLVPFKCIHHMSELSAEYW